MLKKTLLASVPSICLGASPGGSALAKEGGLSLELAKQIVQSVDADTP